MTELEKKLIIAMALDYNASDVEDIDTADYLVLDEVDADEKAEEYIKETLWAFNSNFLANQTGIDEEVFRAIQNNDRCESNNEVILQLVESTCGMDDFVSDAISEDGRGHFLAQYDHEELEATFECETYFVYRIN